MRIALIFIVSIFCCSNICLSNNKLIPVAPGWSKNSVNTAVFRNNSVVSYGEYQFIAFYDNEKNVVVGKRCHGSSEWEINKTQYRGKAEDAHNVISIAVDGDGYLHVAWDHHVNPLNYAVSYSPLSLILKDKEKMTGKFEDKVTYPEFYKFPNGDLLFAYRTGSSGNGNLIMKRYDINNREWTDVRQNLIFGENKRNAYWQICLDDNGVIHISWVWRETSNVATNHDMCYARSSDGGITWKKSDGSFYDLPITSSNAEYICKISQNSELINQTSMAVDESGNPYIASYWREANGVPQYYLIYMNGDKWERMQVSNRITDFTLSGSGTKKIPVSRPKVVAYINKGKVCILYIFRDEERGSKVSVAHTADLEEKTWNYTDLTDFSVNSWEPVIDPDLWKEKKCLNIFVQNTEQGDGEKTVEIDPQMIYILDYKIK